MNGRKRVRRPRSRCVLVSAVLVVVLAGCGSDPGTSAASSGKVDTVLEMPDLEGQTVVINTFGGSFADAVREDVIEPFEAATGAKVVLTTNCCDAFETQVKGGQFAGDVLFSVDYGSSLGRAREGLFKSDPRLAQIAKARGVDPADYQDDLITVHYQANVLAWNTKYANAHPASWIDFFDTARHKGTRGLHTYAASTLEAAELGTGAPGSSLYPIKVDKALAALTTLRKNAPVHFWKDGADLMNQLGTGEIAYSLAYSNRIYQGIQQGLPLDMTFNQALIYAEAAAIPATAKNVDGAVAFIDFVMQPKIQAAFAKASGLSPAYSKAAEMVDPSVRKYMPTTPENLKRAVKVDHDWWLKNTISTERAFTKWLTES